MNHSDDNMPAVSGLGLLLRLVTVLENLLGVAGEILVCAKSGRSLGEPVWLSVEQAAERGGYHQNFIYTLIKEKRLYGHPQRRGYRIFTRHFDLQLSRGFPVLDYQTEAEAASAALASREVWLPAPARPKNLGEVPRLKLPVRDISEGEGRRAARRGGKN